jgi:hypothetical protein
MPLAIELAAARAKVLTPAQILARLSQRLDLFTGGRDADPRQRTLRSTIEWSHDLLDEREQRLFARLSVFVGGCTLESAERAAGADLDTLQSLVEKSLVRRSDARFWMYETIREFAVERLEASGEADSIRLRHAQHFLELAEEAEPHLIREALTRPGPWQVKIEVERDNIRAAMDRFEANREAEHALRMASALAWFFSEKGPIAEGRRFLESALALGNGPPALRTKALSAFAQTAAMMGDLTEAKAAGEASLAQYRELGDTWQIAAGVHNLGYIAAESGDWVTARKLFRRECRALPAGRGRGLRAVVHAESRLDVPRHGRLRTRTRDPRGEPSPRSRGRQRRRRGDDTRRSGRDPARRGQDARGLPVYRAGLSDGRRTVAQPSTSRSTSGGSRRRSAT